MGLGINGNRALTQLGMGSPLPAGTSARSSEPSPPLPTPTPRPPIDIVLPPGATPATDPAPEPVDPPAPRLPNEPLDPTFGFAPASGTWRVPLLPLTLPTIGRIVDDSDELSRLYPRNPSIRATASTRAPALTVLESHGSRPGSANNERSGPAKFAIMAGIGGGLVQNAVDVSRLIKKYPEAMRAGRFDQSLGTIGRLPTALGLTALTRPDSRIIDPLAPRIASAASLGKSFTHIDELAMKSSVLLGASLAGIQLLSAGPNLYDAISKDGPWQENMVRTTSGRAGVLQLAGGTLGVGLFATALRQTAGSGASGVVPRILEAAKAPIMARPIFGQIGTGSAVLVMANELGYLDFLNSGDERSTGAALLDAVHRTPLLNDGAYRSAALLGAGGIVGFKTNRAIAAAGGLSGLGAGHVIGAAVVGSLLGAQILGALKPLNKPPKADA